MHERYYRFMNTSKVLSDIESLKTLVTELQEQVEDLRRVLVVLLEMSGIDAEEKGAILCSIEARAEVVEVETVKVQHEKTIQELLDESQRPH
jgi:cell division FtsZ-interacting protein ZapD